jgi:hypothetical protein
MATPEQTAALAAALRGQRPTTSDMGVYGLVTASDEEDARMQAAAMAQALGLLTGDKVLSQFGQAQLQGASQQEGMLADAGQQRSSNVLRQALAAEEAKRQARIDTERERHNRTMEARPPSNVFLPGPGGQYFMGSTRGDAQVVPVADPTGAPVFSPKADDLKAAEEKAATDATNKKVDLESKYRTELIGLQPIKEYQLAAIGRDKVRSAAKDLSGAGSLAVIFGYMKTLDPTSTVREGEFANAQNAGGVPERIRNTWNSALNGNKLTPEMRAEFVASAESQFKAYEARAKKLMDSYRKLAAENGVDPSRVVLDGLVVGDETPPATPAPSAPPNTVSSTQPRRVPMPEGELTSPAPAITTPSGRRIIKPPANIPPPETDPLRRNAIQGQGTEDAPYIISVAGQKAGYIQSFLSDGEVAYVRDLDGGRVVEKVNGKIRYADGKPPPRFKKAEGK